ncbi:DUF2087 domain-containing protein [Phytohabitans kaempferiae]|uniref:DUF2087 domain-containing protein n=1 Tax=Phytohabitans kaempferiae TaxID=1620943 RepID=A0ABV6M408_9ACTN
MRPDALCGLLAEPDRLTTFAAVVLGASTPSEVATRTGQAAREVAVALRRLEQGGLVTIAGGRIVAETNVFKEAVREHAPPPAAEEDLDPDRAKAAVLRVFIRDGRIVRMPAARGKRRVILEHVAAAFEPGMRYPERAVDAVLRAWHDDHAALRRYLVDEGLMSREDGVYWRTGGYVEV